MCSPYLFLKINIFIFNPKQKIETVKDENKIEQKTAYPTADKDI